mgnify:CR=1 FL=1
MKTYVATPATIERKWLVVDASGKTLGRLATEVAKLLRGKHKPTYTPNVDTGDYVLPVFVVLFAGCALVAVGFVGRRKMA